MKPERTIQVMMDQFPVLFDNRQRCLDHLFVVIGNGYEWFDGELCYLSGPDVMFVRDDPDDEDSDGHYEHTRDSSPDIAKAEHPWSDKDWENYRMEQLAEIQKYYDEAMVRLKEKFPGYKPKRRPPKFRVLKQEPRKENHWYPISWTHSYIANLPEDITPEWKALADECKALLLEDGIDVDNRTVTPEAKEKYKIHYA